MTQVALFIFLVVLAFISGQFAYFAVGRLGFLKDRKDAKMAGRIIAYAIYAVCLYVGVVYVLDQNINSLLTAFGIFGIAVAIASQQTISNLFSSFVIGVQGVLKEGDTIEVNDVIGRVVDTNLVSVFLKSFDGKTLVIPKSYFTSSSFVNYSIGKVMRVGIPLRVKASTDMGKVSATLLDICNKNKDVLPEITDEGNIFKRFFDSSSEKKVYTPAVVLTAVSADVLSIELRVWIYDIARKDVIVSDLLREITANLGQGKRWLKEY